MGEAFCEISGERSGDGLNRRKPVLYEGRCLVLGGRGYGAVRVEKSWGAALAYSSIPAVETPDFLSRGGGCDFEGMGSLGSLHLVLEMGVRQVCRRGL